MPSSERPVVRQTEYHHSSSWIPSHSLALARPTRKRALVAGNGGLPGRSRGPLRGVCGHSSPFHDTRTPSAPCLVGEVGSPTSAGALPRSCGAGWWWRPFASLPLFQAPLEGGHAPVVAIFFVVPFSPPASLPLPRLWHRGVVVAGGPSEELSAAFTGSQGCRVRRARRGWPCGPAISSIPAPTRLPPVQPAWRRSWISCVPLLTAPTHLSAPRGRKRAEEGSVGRVFRLPGGRLPRRARPRRPVQPFTRGDTRLARLRRMSEVIRHVRVSEVNSGGGGAGILRGSKVPGPGRLLRHPGRREFRSSPGRLAPQHAGLST